MNRELVGTPAHSRSILLVFAAVLLFLALRIPLLVVRQPFFDELATVVFARAGWSQQWAMLQQDSASPLYVAIARVWELAGTFTFTAGRVLSLLFGLLSLACLLVATRRWQPAVGATAALLLAAFPPHVYFSTEARAYALAGLLVGAAALSLYQWMESRDSRWLALATLSLVLAAYSHGYGVLLFPAPFVVGLMSGNRAAVKSGLMAWALAGLLFLPGFWLASVQPFESIRWMSVASSEGLLPVLGTFEQLGFAATYPSAIMISPPIWLRLLSMFVVIPVLILGAWKSVPGRLFAAITLLPIAAVLLLALAGRTLYFPVRFESILAVPFVLWLASGLAILPRAFRLAAMSLLLGMGAAVCILAIADHDTRPPDPFRSVSRAVRQRVDPKSTVVVSGYSYLELLNQTDQQWHPQLLTFPREQERHPGWVGRSDPATLQREARGLPDRFVWVGVGFSPEATVLAQHFDLREIARDQVVVAAEAIRKPGGRASEEP